MPSGRVFNFADNEENYLSELDIITLNGRFRNSSRSFFLK